MNRAIMPTMQVGNEFTIRKADMKVEVTAPEASLPPQSLLVAVHRARQAAADSDEPENPVNETANETKAVKETETEKSETPENPDNAASDPKHFSHHHLHHLGRFAKRHWLGSTALVLLLIGSAAVYIGGHYWSSTHIADHSATANVKVGSRPISGLNLTVPAAGFEAKLQSITAQPTTLTVGSNALPVSSDTVRSWLQVTSNKSKSEYYIHLNKAAIAPSLTQLANKYVKSPINQVSVPEDGIERIVAGGRNGTALSDPGSLTTQADQIAKTVMDGKGMQFNTPLATVPFQAVTPANFDKLLVSDIVRKKMWAFQNGQLVKTFLVSAGAPATPTPIGQYKMYAKYSVQDMRGNNADGSRYFQPKVPWVSYFTAGNAVHGVYWRPADWFGNINSSHGCIGVPVSDAKWVYDWAPIGTAVIVHI